MPELLDGQTAEVWGFGSDVYVRYGRIGSDGQSSFKPLASPEAASAHAAKLLQEKTGKGYVVVA